MEELATTLTISELATSIDTVWVLLGAMLVFWMQPGFGLVESGFTRAKNAANIMMKNFVDLSAGSLMYWFVGFGIMFGAGNGFFGEIDFFGTAGWEGDISPTTFLVFQTMFAATAATIVSGAMAERTKFHVYVVYSIVICLIIYPVSGHWGWGGGWLENLGFIDFAGSTLVHSVGGWIALAGAWILGPRLGKYTKDGKAKAIPGHNLTLASLGVFILWLGWFGFNPASQLAASGPENALAISQIFLNTNLSAAAGAVAAIVTSYFLYKKPSLSLTLNGVLAGLVGITAGCADVSAGSSVIIGLISGVVMVFSVRFIDNKLKVDDPVGAISVHGVCGTLGTILVGFFALDGGVFYGGSVSSLLFVQVLGAIAVAAWAFATGYILFKVLDVTCGLRVEKRIEEEGLDIYEHGETTYN